MRRESISDALNMLDDAFIEETTLLRNGHSKPQKNTIVKRISFVAGRYWKWAAVACLALTLVAGSLTLRQKPSVPKPSISKQADQTQKLPMLAISENTSGDMGFEGYMAYDISELVGHNPWSEESQPSVLPVYKNALSYDGTILVSGADFEKMREFLLEIAGRLGIDTESLIILDDTPDAEEKRIITEKMEGDVPEGYFDPTELTAKADGIEITVDREMRTAISFEPAIALPGKYNFTSGASYQEIAAVAEYLKKKYKKILHMENPQINIGDGDYSVYDKKVQQEYSISFYEAGQSNLDEIINYNFNQVEFACDDDGKLYFISIRQPDLSKKTGDYPLITAEEAKKLLLKGNYITTVPYEFPGEKLIAKTELVYRTGAREEYFMPYYRFYVELPEEERKGLKTYGAYYVPAVEKEYLSNMPVWNGDFN